jgi:hypothetical protein
VVADYAGRDGRANQRGRSWPENTNEPERAITLNCNSIQMNEEPIYIYIRNVRDITRKEPEFKHIEVLERELYTAGSDRAIAVMYGSF